MYAECTHHSDPHEWYTPKSINCAPRRHRKCWRTSITRSACPLEVRRAVRVSCPRCAGTAGRSGSTCIHCGRAQAEAGTQAHAPIAEDGSNSTTKAQAQGCAMCSTAALQMLEDKQDTLNTPSKSGALCGGTAIERRSGAAAVSGRAAATRSGLRQHPLRANLCPLRAGRAWQRPP